MSERLRVAGWWLLLASIGWVALASLFDRLAGQGLLVEAPSALLRGGRALTARAALADRAGDHRAAADLAAAALRRRPVDAATLRTAGLIAFAGGATRRGDALLRLAGTAGWRDAPTQLYWAQAALAGGALDVAAERLDAMQRASGDGLGTPESRALVRLLEQTPAGRAALVRRWLTANAWATPYLAEVGALDDAGLDARFLTAVAARRVIGADATRQVARSLALRRPDLAFRLAPVDQHRLAFVPADAAGPFDWTIVADQGLDAELEARGGERVLRLRASGPALIGVATRMLRLAPGTYALAIRLDGGGPPPLLATLQCLPPQGRDAAADPPTASSGVLSFRLHVPPSCSTQRLGLAITGDAARRGADVTLHTPMLSRAAAAP